MIQDFRFAFRQLLKSPGFTFIAVVTLALAIGVNSAIFALINGVVLRPMVPVRPQEVVNVFTARQSANHDYRQFSYTEFRELREHGQEIFADLAALEFAVAGIGNDHEMRRSFAFLTSENFFSLMGVQPYRGRFYNAEECRPNANLSVVVASYGFWQRLGGRADFLGSNLQINGQQYTVIGITPDGFSGVSALIAPEVWLPLGMYSRLGSAFSDSDVATDLSQPKNYTVNLIGRLRPGLTIDMAKLRLPVLSQRFNAFQPPDADFARELQIQVPSRFSLSTSPEDDGPIALIATLLMCMAGAVLLIASLNLANMLLARGTTRAKEIALRIALGASRWRIVRQLLCEGMLLAFVGGAVGLAVSVWCNNLLLHSLQRLLGSMNFSFVADLSPSVAVLSVTFLFCLLATLLFSLVPAIKATKADLVNDLKQQVGEPARVGRLSRARRDGPRLRPERAVRRRRGRSGQAGRPAQEEERRLEVVAQEEEEVIELAAALPGRRSAQLRRPRRALRRPPRRSHPSGPRRPGGGGNAARRASARGDQVRRRPARRCGHLHRDARVRNAVRLRLHAPAARLGARQSRPEREAGDADRKRGPHRRRHRPAPPLRGLGRRVADGRAPDRPAAAAAQLGPLAGR